MFKKNEIEKKYVSLKKKLDRLDFISTGSVMKVYTTCGRPDCDCNKNKRHGPYNIWTRKVNSKTVTRALTEEQARLLRKCILNMREFEKIASQMKELSARYIENYNKNHRYKNNDNSS